MKIELKTSTLLGIKVTTDFKKQLKKVYKQGKTLIK